MSGDSKHRIKPIVLMTLLLASGIPLSNNVLAESEDPTLTYFHAGSSSEYINEISTHYDSYSQSTDWVIDVAYSFEGANARVCVAKIEMPTYDFRSNSPNCSYGDFSLLSYSLYGDLFAIRSQRELVSWDSEGSEWNSVYSFNFDVVAILASPHYVEPSAILVGTNDGIIHWVTTSGDRIDYTQTEGEITAFSQNLYNWINSRVTVSLVEDVLAFDFNSDSLELTGSILTDIGASDFVVELMPIDDEGFYEPIDYLTTQNDYLQAWSLAEDRRVDGYSFQGKGGEIQDIDGAPLCFFYTAHEDGSVYAINACDVDSDELSIESRNKFGSISRGSCDCARVSYVDGDIPHTFVASSGSTIFVWHQNQESEGEGEAGYTVPSSTIFQSETPLWQLKDEEWSDMLCDMGLMCFMKHVIAAPDNERLTYIDTTVYLEVKGGARKPVNAIISDQYGSVVSEEPMECFESGSDATCSVHLQIESNIKRDLAFNSAADMFYGESDSIFNQAIYGAATNFLITALLSAVCAAFAVPSVGTSCIFLAIWVKVKSITTIISLASYANVISDSLGSYENEAFPNRYISAIEVDGTTVDISDIRLHRLNDVDDSTISSLGSKDTLEFLAFSPVDLVLLDDGVELTDHEDMIQLTGDWPIEAVMIQGTGDYTVEVEGTGSGAYSLIGLRNDADTTATESDPAAASVAFLAEREQPISYGQTVSYSTIDRWDWDDEETVDWGYTEDDWFDDSYSDPEGELLMILIPIFLVVALGFVFVRRRGLTHSVLLGKSPTTPRPPGLGRVQRPPGLPGIGPSHIPRHSEQGSISRPPGLPRLDSLKSSMPIRPPELHLAQPREGVPRPKDLIDEIDNPMDSSTQPETSSEQLAPEGYGSKANHPEVPRPDDWD